MKKKNPFTLTISYLAAAKLILDANGIEIITSDNINAIANGVAALAVIWGVYKSHYKKSS